MAGVLGEVTLDQIRHLELDVIFDSPSNARHPRLAAEALMAHCEKHEVRGIAVLHATAAGTAWGGTAVPTAETGVAQSAFGSDFGQVNVYLGNVSHTFNAGNHLLLTVAVAQESTGDV